MLEIIDRERGWLEPLKKISNHYVNTTDLSINLLRKKIKALLNLRSTHKYVRAS